MQLISASRATLAGRNTFTWFLEFHLHSRAVGETGTKLGRPSFWNDGSQTVYSHVDHLLWNTESNQLNLSPEPDPNWSIKWNYSAFTIIRLIYVILDNFRSIYCTKLKRRTWARNRRELEVSCLDAVLTQVWLGNKEPIGQFIFTSANDTINVKHNAAAQPVVHCNVIDD